LHNQTRINPETPPLRLIRGPALRYTLIYFGLFATIAAFAVAYIFWKTNVLLVSTLEEAVHAEIQALDEQYRSGGMDQLRQAIAARAETPGNHLYHVADGNGKYLVGNLKDVSTELLNSTGRVVFTYRRPVQPGKTDVQQVASEERLAFVTVFRLPDGHRLIVGRDIEDQRTFGRIVRQVFLWTLAAMAVLGLGVSILISRHLLRRIDSITETSRTIMAGDLSRRIPLSGSADEFDRLAANLNAMLQRIAELVEGIREVSSNIAHDLKTPLSRLRNRVEIALRDNGQTGDEQCRDTLQATIEEADELIKTFDALLSIARLEAGASSAAKAPFNLNALLDGICELYEPVAEESGMTLRQTPMPETAIEVEGERQLVAQAITNIIDNAIKYAAGSSTDIIVGLVPNGAHVDIVIADHGPGIPKEDRERALKRFVRLEASRSRPGSGLGLSLVAAVARLHGGQVTLGDNQPGLKVVLRLHCS
jgi:signal transduction histidine kinase